MVGVKIPRVGVKITRGSLTPGGQAAQGVKINCYTGSARSKNYCSSGHCLKQWHERDDSIFSRAAR